MSHQPCLTVLSDKAFNLNVQVVGALFPYVLDEPKLNFISENGAFTELSDILAKEEVSRTPFEKILVTAIRWLGRSIVASDVPEQVLNMVISLERLMISEGERGEKKETLALRLAFVIGDNADNRSAIYKRAKKLYELRSDVVHDGRVNVNPSDVAELEDFTRDALIEMARHSDEWRTHSDFTDWVRSQVFATG